MHRVVRRVRTFRLVKHTCRKRFPVMLPVRLTQRMKRKWLLAAQAKRVSGPLVV